MPIQNTVSNTQGAAAPIAGGDPTNSRNQACAACKGCPNCAKDRGGAQDLMAQLKKLLGIDEQGTQQGVQDALKDPNVANNPVLQQVLQVLGMQGGAAAGGGK